MKEWFDDDETCRRILLDMQKALGKQAAHQVLLRAGQNRPKCQIGAVSSSIVKTTRPTIAQERKSRGGALP